MKSFAKEPQAQARAAGLLYLLIFIAAPSGASSATVPKMIVTLICDTGVALLLYHLLKPVSAAISLMAALLRLTFVAVMAVTSLNYFGYLTILNGAHSASAFLSGYLTALVFFGFHILLIGHLIFRSTFFPRFLGVLLLAAGPTYPINRFANFLSLKLADVLWYGIMACWVLAEGSLTLWLLVMGVNVPRWKQQASVETTSG